MSTPLRMPRRASVRFEKHTRSLPIRSAEPSLIHGLQARRAHGSGPAENTRPLSRRSPARRNGRCRAYSPRVVIVPGASAASRCWRFSSRASERSAAQMQRGHMRSRLPWRLLSSSGSSHPASASVRASGSFGCCLGSGSGGGDRASPLRDRLRQAQADVRNPRPPPGLREQFVEDRAAMRPASTPANDREPCPPVPWPRVSGPPTRGVRPPPDVPLAAP
jgi:hypothetical protein